MELSDVRSEVLKQLPNLDTAAFDKLGERVLGVVIERCDDDIKQGCFDTKLSWEFFLKNSPGSTATIDETFAALKRRADAAAASVVQVQSNVADADQQKRIADYRFRHTPPVEALRSAAPLPAEVYKFSAPSKLIAAHMTEKPFIIDNVLRRGEVMSLIAPPKTGKSWIVHDLALAVRYGRKWLDTYHTVKGRVTLVDNELSRETLSQRLRALAALRGVTDYADLDAGLDVLAVRGCARNVFDLENDVFNTKQEDGTSSKDDLVILDSLYEFYWAGFNENSNSDMGRLIGVIKGYATRYDRAVVIVHHSSKGSQSAKDITDVGAGAGALSRAVDTHCALRWTTSTVDTRRALAMEFVTRSSEGPAKFHFTPSTKSVEIGDDTTTARIFTKIDGTDFAWTVDRIADRAFTAQGITTANLRTRLRELGMTLIEVREWLSVIRREFDAAQAAGTESQLSYTLQPHGRNGTLFVKRV